MAKFNQKLALDLLKLGFSDMHRLKQIDMTAEARAEAVRAFGGRNVLAAQDAALPASNKALSLVNQFFYPEVLEVFREPLTADILAPTEQLATWTTEATIVREKDYAGNYAPYGDFSREGAADVNPAEVTLRQTRFQTMISYGELEAEMSADSFISLVAEKNEAASRVINKGHNDIGLYGVKGTSIYGLMNHPDLPADLAPTAGAGGATWANKTYDEAMADLNLLYRTLIQQGRNLITNDTPMTLAMSAVSYSIINDKEKQYTDRTVLEAFKARHPNIIVKTVYDFDTPSGELVQLSADYITRPNGTQQAVMERRHSELFRTHRVIQDVSSDIQKKSGGTWGAILWVPWGIKRMVGV